MTKQPNGVSSARIEASRMQSDYERILERLDRAITEINQIRDDMDRMNLPAPNGYNSLTTFLTEQVTNDPEHVVWKPMATELTMAKSEFDAKLAQVVSLVGAIDTIMNM